MKISFEEKTFQTNGVDIAVVREMLSPTPWLNVEDSVISMKVTNDGKIATGEQLLDDEFRDAKLLNVLVEFGPKNAPVDSVTCNPFLHPNVQCSVDAVDGFSEDHKCTSCGHSREHHSPPGRTQMWLTKPISA